MIFALEKYERRATCDNKQSPQAHTCKQIKVENVHSSLQLLIGSLQTNAMEDQHLTCLHFR